MLQTSYNIQVQCFSSEIIFTSQPNYSITSRASRAFEHYLQVENLSTSILQSSATNIFSSSTRVFIEEMRRWDLIKDLLGQLIQTLILLGLWWARWRSLHMFVCINCFTFKSKARWELLLTFKALFYVVITLLTVYNKFLWLN